MTTQDHENSGKVVEITRAKRTRDISEGQSVVTDYVQQVCVAQAKAFEPRLRELREALQEAEHREVSAREYADRAQRHLTEVSEEVESLRIQAGELFALRSSVQSSKTLLRWRREGMRRAIDEATAQNGATRTKLVGLLGIGWLSALSDTADLRMLGVGVLVVAVIGLVRHLSNGL